MGDAAPTCGGRNESKRLSGQLNDPTTSLANSYRVIGRMGCQLRETESMDSKPLTCLPKGSVVTVICSTVSSEYNILAPRVLVRHVEKDPSGGGETIIEGM